MAKRRHFVIILSSENPELEFNDVEQAAKDMLYEIQDIDEKARLDEVREAKEDE